MKKIYALLFAAISALSATAAVWDGTSTAITAGSGTESDPYLIETPQHMAWFAEQVNAGNTFENQYFKLMYQKWLILSLKIFRMTKL